MVDLRNQLPDHPHKRYPLRKKKITRVVLHCTAGMSQDPFDTNNFHITKRNWPRIAYHDYIDHEGTHYWCNDYDRVTWGARGWNADSVHVVMAFEGGKNMLPPKPQWEATIAQLATLCHRFDLSYMDVKGHRESPKVYWVDRHGSTRYHKWCPGIEVDLDEMRCQVWFKMKFPDANIVIC